MDQKRLLVRYLILSSHGIVLGIKVNLMLFIVDFYIGIYGLLTSIKISSMCFISFLNYKDPYLAANKHVIQNDNNYSSFVSIVVAVKNEEGNI